MARSARRVANLRLKRIGDAAFVELAGRSAVLHRPRREDEAMLTETTAGQLTELFNGFLM